MFLFNKQLRCLEPRLIILVKKLGYLGNGFMYFREKIFKAI